MGFHEKPYENEVFWWEKGVCVPPAPPGTAYANISFSFRI